MMKRIMLCVLMLLLLTLTFLSLPSISKVSATANDDLRVDYGLPEDIPHEPMPQNYTTENYLNTTNPYADYAGIQGALDEVDDSEGNHPLYVLVFGDEEERGTNHYLGSPEGQYTLNWELWATLQLERGDNALAANFGIDIRILGCVEWDSNDSLDSMYDLWSELEVDGEQYLRTWYDGVWWSNYVDAIIGITAQSTPADPKPIAGLAPGSSLLDQGRIYILLKWQVYWMDDNLAQHEVSHLYYAPDHPNTCCAMAYHTHFQSFIWESRLWWVFADVPCSYTAYSWCISCHQTIQQNSGRYPIRTLTISSSSGGTTNPAPGTYTYGNGSSVTVTAVPTESLPFCYWLLDEATVFENPVTITMDSGHILNAYFCGGCPFLYVWNDSKYNCEGLLDIHNPDGVDVVTNHTLIYTLKRVNGTYLLRLVEHPQTHSYIDQVKLYAILEKGKVIQLPLIYAQHSQYGDVVRQILFSDDRRTETIGANHNNRTSQSINLKFLALPPYLKAKALIFQIEGYNPLCKD